MAAVLIISEITSTSITATLSGLDESYTGSIRQAEWSCSSGEAFSHTIPEGMSSISHKFEGLSPGTRYTVTVKITGITGSADKEWSKTAVTPSFTAFEHYGGIKYRVKFTGLRADDGDTVYCTLDYKGKNTGKSGYISISSVSDAPKTVIEKEGVIYPLPNDDYTLSLMLINGNDSETYREYEDKAYVTVNSPACNLKYRFIKKDFSGVMTNGGTYYYTCESYPVIKASDFTAFQNDINAIRASAESAKYSFTAVKPGDAFRKDIFNELYFAIYGIAAGFTDIPEKFREYKARQTISAAYLKSLSSVLQGAKDYYYSQKNT